MVNDIKQLINIKEDLEDSERLFYTVSNVPIYAKAKGDLVIKIKNCKFTINNAYYIPGIQLNLISFNDLLNKGFLILFDNDYLFLIKKSNGKCFNIAKRDTNSNLFNNIRSRDFFSMKLSRKIIDELNNMNQKIINKKTLNYFNNKYIKISNMNHEIANPFKRKRDLMYYHLMGNHMSLESMKYLIKSGHIKMSSEITASEEERVKSCNECLAINSKQSSHNHTHFTAPRRLFRLHSDTLGIFSHRGKKYYITTLIDEYSGYLNTIWSEHKSIQDLLFEKIRIWNNKFVDANVAFFRTDNALEMPTKDQLAEIGIEKDEIASYSPELNGISERTNRSIIQFIRKALLPIQDTRTLYLLPKIVDYVTYIRNMTPVRSKGGLCPYALFYDTNKFHYNPIQFGLDVIVKLSSTVEAKKYGVSNSKTSPCILFGTFIGYGTDVHVYKVILSTKDFPIIVTPNITLMKSMDNLKVYLKSLDYLQDKDAQDIDISLGKLTDRTDEKLSIAIEHMNQDTIYECNEYDTQESLVNSNSTIQDVAQHIFERTHESNSLGMSNPVHSNYTMVTDTSNDFDYTIEETMNEVNLNPSDTNETTTDSNITKTNFNDSLNSSDNSQQKSSTHQTLPHPLAPDKNDEINKINEDGNTHLSLESSTLSEKTPTTQNNVRVSTRSKKAIVETVEPRGKITSSKDSRVKKDPHKTSLRNSSKSSKKINDLQSHAPKVNKSLETIPYTVITRSMSRKLNSQSSKSNSLVTRKINTVYRKVDLTDNNWKQSIQRELDTFKKYEVYTVVKIPKNVKPIPTTWVHTHKINDLKEVQYKSRCVVQGFRQIANEHYDTSKVSSPVIELSIIRLLTAIAVEYEWPIHHLDISSAYLHADIDYEKSIFVKPPPGSNIDSGKCWQLNKSVYGMKQAGYMWYQCITKVLMDLNFEPDTAISGMFCKYFGENKKLIVALYVDDMFLTSSNITILNDFKLELAKHFDLKYFADISEFLGIEFIQIAGGYRLSQHNFLNSVIKKFNLTNNYGKYIPIIKEKNKISETQLKSEFTNDEVIKNESLLNEEDKRLYQSGVGSLLWAANNTRPDISFAVNQLSSNNQNPTSVDLEKLIYCLRYVKQTISFSLEYKRNRFSHKKGSFIIQTFSDGSFAPTKDRRLITGYTVYLNGNLINWSTIRQKVITDSSAACEINALHSAVRSTLKSRQAILDLNLVIDEITLFEDNAAVIANCNNEGTSYSRRMVDIKLKFIRQLVSEGILKLKYVNTSINIADMLTKALSRKLFENLRSLLFERNDLNKE